MIEITKVGLINIDKETLEGLPRFEWVVVAASGPCVEMHFVQNGGQGATRIRYYKDDGGAQVQIEGLKPGFYKTITRPYTISFNLDKDISNDY